MSKIETFTIRSENTFRCNICEFDYSVYEVAGHKHVALRPVEMAGLEPCIVWRNSNLMLCKVTSGYAKELLYDMVVMAANNYSIGSIVIDDDNAAYMLVKAIDDKTAWAVGYIALSYAKWSSRLPQTRHIVIMPDFIGYRYGWFLLLKSLQHLSDNKRFTVFQPHDDYKHLLTKMRKAGYLRKYGINYTILKKPTTRLIRTKRAERSLSFANSSANEACEVSRRPNTHSCLPSK